MSQTLRFFHRGEIVQLAASEWPTPTRSVLDWLRTSAGCHGTKEGCNEGDCGACTVVVADLAEPGDPEAIDGLRWRTLNACLQFLPTLEGRALFTVEDLQGPEPDAALHPVQQSLVDAHGSQCGFCTPGIVMSLWGLYLKHRAQGGSRAPDRQTIADALSGNLCRCTGYRPILEAAERMFDLPPRPFDTQAIVTALRALQASADSTSRETPNGTSPGASDAPIPDDALTPAAGGRWFAPRTSSELARLRQALPQARLLAGGTDIGLWVNKQHRDLGDLIFLGQVRDLECIERIGREPARQLRLGAGVSLERGWQALSGHWPELTELWRRFASPAVRHAGTLVGNLANGSPIGDTAPVLLALDAELELRQGEAVRILPLEAFYLDYMRNAMQPGEFVQAVRIPLSGPPPGQVRQLRAYKISKRFDCDISALCLAARLDFDGEQIHSARLAFGGMAATVRRAPAAEATLSRASWSEDTVRAVQAALAQDFQPLTDLRGSAAYRLKTAQALIQRLWLQTRRSDPLDDADTRVHAWMQS
jgi:xanthine dehydrogenase small subunit